MRLLAITALAFLAASLACAKEPLLLPFPGPAALRLDVTVDGRPAATGWAEFLDKLFDYFDRDGDGSLSPAEAGRVFPLPISGRESVPADFVRTDTDRDGKASRAEFREFYRTAGFTPIAVEFQRRTDDIAKAGAVLLRAFDRDGDGRLSREELTLGNRLIRRFDENDDEVLTPTELIASDPDVKPLAEKAGVPATASGQPNAVLRLPLGKSDVRPSLTDLVGDTFGKPDTKEGRMRFRFPGGVATVVVSAPSRAGFTAVRSFYLAQFQAAVAGGTAVRKAQAEDDPAVQGMAGLFGAADRDADGALTRSELDRFLDLIELGVRCRPVVRVEDWGRNPFTALDANEDGRLTPAELDRAATVISPDGVPRQIRVMAGLGPVAPTFGPVFVSVPVKRPAPTAGPVASGPRWFRAMDRNGDGFVSPHEFAGTPDHFRRLDADGDGRIGEGEASPDGR